MAPKQYDITSALAEPEYRKVVSYENRNMVKDDEMR